MATTIPPTHRAFRRSPGLGTSQTPLTLSLSIEPILPSAGLGTHDVLIRIRAVSLNYRDALMLRGLYPGPALAGGIAASDCSAEVVAVGDRVTLFRVGDRVAPNFDLGNLTGEIGAAGHLTVGGDVDGVLREFAVFEERVLVRLPGYLSWEEGATIACAGLTAWKAVGAPDSLDKNKSILIQGTGGVSMFALLIALAGGLKPIITSSSDEKLAVLAKKLGAPSFASYNYRTDPDQVAEVQRLTGGKGVDVVVNNIGPPGIPADIDSLVPSFGLVSLVGFLAGVSADWNPGKLLSVITKTARLQGVAVGSKVEFEALISFLEQRQVRLDTLIDSKIFDFEDSQAALDYLWSGKHVGKVVIRLG
ncbi:uncharacterized protein B0H64DRAFT_363427 [Chaetomium fimeti]|uniref:Enoyl reductase (ER) domain-containing protein n=1 Tax=Chaetomium fimeti TaxID=1854472 RepID=A0AAE0LPI8_9PEZI|nr:hypothetical protein B0H64DRAFT_363427 [Chaetomium fimeti]